MAKLRIKFGEYYNNFTEGVHFGKVGFMSLKPLDGANYIARHNAA